MTRFSLGSDEFDRRVRKRYQLPREFLSEDPRRLGRKGGPSMAPAGDRTSVVIGVNSSSALLVCRRTEIPFKACTLARDIPPIARR